MLGDVAPLQEIAAVKARVRWVPSGGRGPSMGVLGDTGAAPHRRRA